MPDPVTTNVLLAIPSHGSDVDTWDGPLNADFSSVDGFIGGVQAITVSGATPITLTSPAGTPTPAGGPTQAQNMMLRLTGTPTGNVIITLPLPCRIFIDNQAAFSSGGFVTLRAAGSGQVVGVPFGAVTEYVNDGTNVKFANLTPFVGQYVDYAGAGLPGWITASTIPPFLLCDGSAFSAVTFPLLAAVLGSTNLPDFRGRAPYFLNGGTARLTSAGAGIDGNTIFAAGGANGVTLAASQIPTITASNSSQSITASLPGGGKLPYGNVGDLTQFSAAATGAFVSIYSPGNQWTFTNSITSNNAISATYTNSSQVIVGSPTPGIVGGIRMIRAG